VSNFQSVLRLQSQQETDARTMLQQKDKQNALNMEDKRTKSTMQLLLNQVHQELHHQFQKGTTNEIDESAIERITK
jgi:folate-dependent phosphoribosylglycinamide formyltransferase PurN